jgi:hypothetical protein
MDGRNWIQLRGTAVVVVAKVKIFIDAKQAIIDIIGQGAMSIIRMENKSSTT